MANITKIYEIKLQGEAQLIKEMRDVNKQFDDAKKKFQGLKILISQGGLSSVEMAKYKVELQQAKVETERLRQETVRLTNEGKAQINALRTQKEAQRENREQTKASLTEYKLLTKNLNDLRNNAKEIGVVFGTLSPEFRQAATTANNLDKEIKQIDAALGQFQRNVGNYPKEINIGSISSGAFDDLRKSGMGDLLGRQIDQTQGKVLTLNQTFVMLQTELNDARASGVGDLNAIEQAIIANRIETDRLNNEIRQSTMHINGMGSAGSGVFGQMGGDLKNMILGYVGFQAAMMGVQQLVGGAKELSDQTTNLEIELDKAAGGANKLVAELGALDTRTKLGTLEEMANIAAKAGVSEENLVGVTQAIDKIKIAFGKDFGDVETGTESLVKIINIFEGADQVNGENLLKTGNALRTLANESVASVPFITDFTKRMAGLKGIADISLPSVLGLASGFEQFGQTSEVSSTALVKIIPKIAKDVEKFAKVAGMTNSQFKRMIDENPAEVLIKVSEGLMKNKNGLTDISKSFADSELGSGRIASVLGVIGKNGEQFRKSIESAGKAYQNTGNIEDAFAAKNNNLAAKLDKISKKFTDLGGDTGFQNVIIGLSESILYFIKLLTAIPFGFIITGISLFSAAMLYSRGATISAGLATAWNSEQTLLGTIRNLAYRLGLIQTGTAQFMVTRATQAQALATTGATVAQTGLNVAMRDNPLGIVLSLLALVVPFLFSFTSGIDDSTDAMKKNNDETLNFKKQLGELSETSAKSTADIKASVSSLLSVLKDESIAFESRKKAYQKLVEISPVFNGYLKDEKFNITALTAVYNEYIKALDKVAYAKEFSQLNQGNIKKQVDSEQQVFATLKKLQEAKAKFDKAELERKKGSDINRKTTVGEYIASKDDYNKALLDYNNAKLVLEKSGNLVKETNDFRMSKITELQKNINIGEKTLLSISDKASEAFKNSTIKLKGDKDALDAILGVSSTTNSTSVTPEDSTSSKGSKLTGSQNDYLKNLEAKRDQELAINEELHTKRKISETNYLTKIRDLNVTFYDAKINYLKGKNAEELKEKAEASLAKAKIEQDTNEKLFALQEQELKQTLENETAKAKAKLDSVNADPFATNVEKAQAEVDFNQAELSLFVEHNVKMDALEKAFNLVSKKNTQDRNNLILNERIDLNGKLGKLSKEKFEQVIDGVQNFENFQKNNAELAASRRKIIVLNDKSLLQKEKEHEYIKTNSALVLASINAELGGIITQIAFYEERKKQLALTVDEQKKLNDLQQKKPLLEEKKAFAEQELKVKAIVELELPNIGDLQSKIQSLFSDANGKFIIGKDKEGNDVDGSKMLGQAIAQSFDLASQAMNSYFEGEKQAVEQSKQLAYQRIDIEKRQLMAKAQSQSERDSIERQSTEKKKVADKEAGEKLKKIKKSEAAVAFATQLAYIAVAAAQNPLNGVTLGAAGIAMYGVLAGIATAGYLMNVANINKQQFGKGGKYGAGGKLHGPAHNQNHGMPVINPNTGEVQAYMEGDEGIINKRSMMDGKNYTVSGTPNQIASKINAIGGGVDWAGGATMTKFMNGGKYLGSNLQPPMLGSYYESRTIKVGSEQNVDLSEIKEMLLQTNATLNLEVNRKTIISSKEMTEIQRENQKQSDIGTL